MPSCLVLAAVAIIVLGGAAPSFAQEFRWRTYAAGLGSMRGTNGVAVADFDGDGDLDIYFVVFSIEAGGSHAGSGWGTAFFDLENDGNEDLFVVTGNFAADHPNVLFRNATEGGALRFEETAAAYGVADLAPARGLVVFDYDGDGDQDLLISNVYEEPALYENRTAAGNWLQVTLRGSRSTRDGIGAMVYARAGGVQYQRYHHGAQFLGQSIIPVHFGLNDAVGGASIEVVWPSGIVDEIKDASMNQTMVVEEGRGMISGEVATFDERVNRGPSDRRSGSYPEPFGVAATASFELFAPGSATMTVFNLLGQTVDEVAERFTTMGRHVMTWRPGPNIGPGVYLYAIVTSGGPPVTGTMVYVGR